VVGEASDGAEALRLAQELTPDVLLLDMEMPGLKGVEVAHQLKQAGSPVRILALSAYDDSQYIPSLLAAGAAGYLTKDEVPETIIEAVRGVSRGEQGWVSRRVAAKMAAQEIGATLGISEKTVEKHLEAIFRKLGVASRVEAAVLAVKENLV
jgi:DNA-binding NarL/FixJ family response regulator